MTMNLTKINKAEVYRKASEILLRDGRIRGALAAEVKPDSDEYIAHENEEGLTNPEYSVCALGACARAEYELYGTLPVNYSENGMRRSVADAVYYAYNFLATDGDHDLKIWTLNDRTGGNEYSDEDIALILKREAEKVESGDHRPVDS